MGFRVKIITPLQVDDVDLNRRRRRYGERASGDTEIEVVGLGAGPYALETAADLAASDDAVFEEGAKTGPNEFDAVLIDCIFDPAVDRLRDVLPMPVFGPLRTALPLLSLVAPRFGIIARGKDHEALFTELVDRYGHGDQLIAVRTLALPYAEAKDPERFGAAMREQLKRIIEDDGARAVVMGSTTMALSPEVAAAGGDVPLFLTGMMTLGIMESLWRDGLISQ
jgi:allantoin racemase